MSIKTILTRTLLLLTIISVPSMASDQEKGALPLDFTTGKPWVRNVNTELIPLSPGLSTGARILWDTHHGVYFNYRPLGRFSGWKSLMEAKGHIVIEDDQGILAHELIGYDVLVISLGSAWYSAYTEKEIRFIMDFVSGGGSLLILGDNAFTPNENINPVSTRFGTELGLNILEPLNVFFTQFNNHPSMNGILTLLFRAGGEIEPQFGALAFTDGGQTVLASTEYGAGRVFLAGDMNFMDNTYIHFVDNQLFTENIFDWLLFDL